MTSTKKAAAHRTANNKTTKASQRRNGENGSVKFGLLPTYLGYQIRQAQTAIFRDLAAAISGLKVTPGEYGLLSLVEANPGISQVDLAQVYGLDKSTLSLAVSRLTGRGLIRRRRSAEDGRYYTLQLLEPGKRLLQRVRNHVETLGTRHGHRAATGRARTYARHTHADFRRVRPKTRSSVTLIARASFR